MMPTVNTTEHGSLPLYQSADYCGHPEPPEGTDAWDAWMDDHPNCEGFNAEPICLLTPAGEFCPACTGMAREEQDLPVDEYVGCAVAVREKNTTEGG
jgi:hypothetical protein